MSWSLFAVSPEDFPRGNEALGLDGNVEDDETPLDIDKPQGELITEPMLCAGYILLHLLELRFKSVTIQRCESYNTTLLDRLVLVVSRTISRQKLLVVDRHKQSVGKEGSHLNLGPLA